MKLIFVAILVMLLAACSGGSDTNGGGSGYSQVPTSAVDTPISAPSTQDAPIDGLECDPGMSVSFHIHIRLFVWISGQSVQIPATLGHGQSGCLYWIHTHDDAGYSIIHIEAPEAFTPNLQQILDDWQKTAPNSYPSETQWTVWYNGTQVQGGVKFQDIHFGEHDVITIAYNTTNVPVTSPSDYNWDGY
jgi:hypothetical protein